MFRPAHIFLLPADPLPYEEPVLPSPVLLPPLQTAQTVPLLDTPLKCRLSGSASALRTAASGSIPAFSECQTDTSGSFHVENMIVGQIKRMFPEHFLRIPQKWKISWYSDPLFLYPVYPVFFRNDPEPCHRFSMGSRIYIVSRLKYDFFPDLPPGLAEVRSLSGSLFHLPP